MRRRTVGHGPFNIGNRARFAGPQKITAVVPIGPDPLRGKAMGGGKAVFRSGGQRGARRSVRRSLSFFSQPRFFGGVSYLQNRSRSARTPISVGFRSGQMELPNYGDTAAREHP
jgi:hypothetical protein